MGTIRALGLKQTTIKRYINEENPPGADFCVRHDYATCISSRFPAAWGHCNPALLTLIESWEAVF